MRWFRDGDQICVTQDDFVDLQKSPAFFLQGDCKLAQKLEQCGFSGLSEDNLNYLQRQLQLRREQYMDMSELAALMLKWEETKRALDEMGAQIKEAVLEIGKTQNVGRVRASYSGGRKSYDYVTAGKQAPQEIIVAHTVQPPMPAPVTDWRAVCKAAKIDPPFTKSEPRVTVKLIQ